MTRKKTPKQLKVTFRTVGTPEENQKRLDIVFDRIFRIARERLLARKTSESDLS